MWRVFALCRSCAHRCTEAALGKGFNPRLAVRRAGLYGGAACNHTRGVPRALPAEARARPLCASMGFSCALTRAKAVFRQLSPSTSSCREKGAPPESPPGPTGRSTEGLSLIRGCRQPAETARSAAISAHAPAASHQHPLSCPQPTNLLLHQI